VIRRQPILHFLVLGGLLFLVRTGATRVAPRPAGPVPGDEELLYRAAVASGLDRGSEVVNQRLIDNMRFLEGGETRKSPASLHTEAVSLGFDRTDPVVRRVLVEQMRLVAESSGKPEAPTVAELANYLRRHQKRFRQPGQVRLSHVFLDADRRGAALEGDARRLLARLQAERITPDAAPALGDPFLPGHHPALATPRDLAKIYGPAFARVVAGGSGLPEGRWLGPVPSTYGLHLVWIHESLPGAPATLAEVRNQVVLGLADERREARLAAFLRERREQPGGSAERRPHPRPLSHLPPTPPPGEGRKEAPEISSEVAP
jgi:peptidyl-prolyl cis-trans isomerase C